MSSTLAADMGHASMENGNAAAELATRVAASAAIQDLRLELEELSGEEALAKAGYLLDVLRSNGNSVAASRARLPGLVSGHELFAKPVEPLRMLVAPILPRARHGAVYGAPGAGKSQLMRIVCGGVASGARDVLGRFHVQGPETVLWITTEEDEAEMRLGTAITAAGAGYDLDAVLDNVLTLPLRASEFTLADPAHRVWLEARIAEAEPALIVADSLASMSGHDLKDDQAILPLLRWAGRISTSMDATWCWVAHDRKENPNAATKSNDLDDLFGSRQVSAQLDFAYRLLKAGNDRVFRCAKMRGAAEPEDVTLEIRRVPDQMFEMRCVTGMSRMSRQPELVDAIRSRLADHPGDSMSGVRDTVARQLRTRPADVGEILKDLLAQGLVENRGTSHRFKLHWVTEACPNMSEHVPDTLSSHHVRMSHPLKGGTTGQGHDQDDRALEEEWESIRARDGKAAAS